MALFYKYAKALNEAHALYKAGKTEEAHALFKSIMLDTEEEKQALREAQDQLVIYAQYVEEELKKPEYGEHPLSSLYFSMGLGTPEQLETYNRAFDACIARLNIGEVIEIKPGEIIAKPFTAEEREEFNKTYAEMQKYFEEEDKKSVPLFPSKRIDYLVFPLDKVTMSLFDPEELLNVKKNGQLVFVGTEANPGAITMALVEPEDAEGISFSKTISRYDELVYDVIGTYYEKFKETGNANFCTISLTTIWRAMGYKGTPNATQLKNIENSINNMRHTDIYLDNITVRSKEGENISDSRKRGKPKIGYKGRLLPVDFIEISFKGKVTDRAIIIKEYPILTKFAVERKEYTTIDIGLLEADAKKIRLTPSTINIRSYLLRTISRMKWTPTKDRKNDLKKYNHPSNYIRFDTLLKKCNIKNDKNALRNWDKVEYFLNLFKEKGFIKGYKVHNYKTIDGSFEIFYETNTKKGGQNDT